MIDLREANGNLHDSAIGTGVAELAFSNGTKAIKAKTAVPGARIEFPFHFAINNFNADDEMSIKVYINGIGGTLIGELSSGSGRAAGDYICGVMVFDFLATGINGVVRVSANVRGTNLGEKYSVDVIVGDFPFNSEIRNTVDFTHAFTSESEDNDVCLRVFRKNYFGC